MVSKLRDYQLSGATTICRAERIKDTKGVELGFLTGTYWELGQWKGGKFISLAAITTHHKPISFKQRKFIPLQFRSPKV